MSTYYNENNELSIGNLSLNSLADKYDTPLIVYDEKDINNRIDQFHQGFQLGLGVKEEEATKYYSISYASKAFSNIQMLKLVANKGLDLDVVSLGELYMAVQAGFPTERIHFHGNNKTNEEISYALNLGIGHFVIDSFDEINRLNELVSDPVDVMIRLNPGIAPQTHEFIQTSQEDSKFGFSLNKELAEEAINHINESEYLKFIGIHFHVGSQVKDSSILQKTAKIVLKWAQEKAITLKFLNVGGGFSIQYTEEDQPFEINEGISRLAKDIKKFCEENKIRLPKIGIEPGRSLIGGSAVTIYEVGTIKHIPDLNSYVSVDGGMSDHIRTALYGAEYTIITLSRDDNDNSTVPMHVVGKLCESGDIIGKYKPLPKSLKIGDRIAVLSTGAYHYSMASNYNNMLKPAVVFVNEEEHRLVVKRQTLDQLLINEVE